MPEEPDPKDPSRDDPPEDDGDAGAQKPDEPPIEPSAAGEEPAAELPPPGESDDSSSAYHSMSSAAAAALRSAMVDLRDEARAIVEQRIFERLPFDEIARRVGRNRPETVKAIFHRSMARMQGRGSA